MNRAEKTASIDSLHADFGRASLAVVAEYRGLTAGQMNHLRAAVRKVDGQFRVAKNTLVRRAVGEGANAGAGAMMRGPVAMILAFKDPIAVAKVAVKFAADLPKLEIKGAVLDGQVLAAAAVEALANLPPREVVLGQLLGLLQAPATHLVRLLNEPASRVARLASAVAKQREGQ